MLSILLARTSRSLEEAVAMIRSQLDERGPGIPLTLTRSDTLYEALEELSLYEEDRECLQKLSVTFVDRVGGKEAGIDDGGPSREMACLVAQQLRHSEYLRGKYN